MKREPFSDQTKETEQAWIPESEGLYRASNEHDACGVGMLVNIHGNKFSFFHKMICKHSVMELY